MSNAPRPKNVLPDLIIPVMALAFTLYYLTTITEVPWISQASAVTVSAMLLIALAAFGLRTIYRIRLGVETISARHLVAPDAVMAKRLMLLALTIAYVALIESMGFSLTTFIFVLLGILLLSSPTNWKRALCVASLCAVCGYVVFIYFFNTRFPKGVIEHSLKGLL